eukprot:jgi/Pico_ML_1/55257/g142.t1
MADDVFMAGMFLAYLCFIPLCEPGTIDGPSLQRLLESTFQADVSAFRDYCEADERSSGAIPSKLIKGANRSARFDAAVRGLGDGVALASPRLTMDPAIPFPS